MGDNNSTPENVARAILAVGDCSSTFDTRKSAFEFLESIKSRDVQVLANTSILLVKKEWSSEIRLYAFKMLQHLVRLRWDEFIPKEHRELFKVSLELLSEVANACEDWSLKSQSAVLVAEIIRREGPNLWRQSFASLASLPAQGPIQAEVVLMILRWLPQDITVHDADLEDVIDCDRRRLRVQELTQSLPEIFPLLYTLLQRHFEAAMSEAGRKQVDLAKQHADVVTACLNAIIAYAEWAPVPDLARHGILFGCSCLLSSPDFRLHACEVFKLVCSRKRPSDASTAEFDTVISHLFQTLTNISREFLLISSSSSSVIDEHYYGFAACLCKSMASLGSTNLQCISSDGGVMAVCYLQQMLGFFQHSKLVFHIKALIFWLDILPKQVKNKKTLSLINDDICSALLDVCFKRMLKKEKFPPGIHLSLHKYQSKLLKLLKCIASIKPLVCSTRISERVILTVIKNLLVSPSPLQDVVVMDSLQSALAGIVATIFDGSNVFAGGSSEIHHALPRIFEGFLLHLLALKWKEPELIKIHVCYLDSMAPFLKYFPDALESVINKLVELVTSLPCAKDDEVGILDLKCFGIDRRRKPSSRYYQRQLHVMLDDPATNSIVSWSKSGKSFIVWNVNEFCSDVLPRFFGFKQMTPFICQLGILGFKKIESGVLEYGSDDLVKGQTKPLASLGEVKARLKNIFEAINQRKNVKAPDRVQKH